MGYAGLTPHGYERKRQITDTVIIAVRKYVQDAVLSWSDPNIANWIDEIIVNAEKDENNIEIFWRDDFATEVFPIRVIRIDDHWTASHGPPRGEKFRLYAVIKKNNELLGPEEVVLTVVDEKGHYDAVFSRYWLPQKPEESRFRHPGEPEQVEEQMEEEVCQMEEQRQVNISSNTGRDFEPLLISYTKYSDEGVPSLEIIHSSRGSINTHLKQILDKGTPAESIQVWRQVKSTIKVVIEVEE